MKIGSSAVYTAFVNYTRRDLSLLLPALAAHAAAQNRALESRTYSFPELPVRGAGANRQRAVLKGETHTAFPVEVHLTELAPGQAPHPPHDDVHDDMIMIWQGTLEVTMCVRIASLVA